MIGACINVNTVTLHVTRRTVAVQQQTRVHNEIAKDTQTIKIQQRTRSWNNMQTNKSLHADNLESTTTYMTSC